MSSIRTMHNKFNPYVQINKKTLETVTLSWEARGLWAFLLSRPDNWVTNVKHLIKSGPCYRDKIYRILKELQDHSLCIRTQKKREGRWDTGDYIIFESPEVFNYYSEEFKKDEVSKKGDSIEGLKKCLPYTDFTDTVNPFTYQRMSSTSKNKKKKVNQRKLELSNHETEKRGADSPSAQKIASPSAHRCSLFLLDERKKKNPKTKPPNLKKWSMEIDKLLKKSSQRSVPYTEKEVMSVIKFSLADSFWQKNILSASSLTKHMDRLFECMKAPKSDKSVEEDKKTKRDILIEENRQFAKKFIDENKSKFSIIENIKMEEFHIKITKKGDSESKMNRFIGFAEETFKKELQNFLKIINGGG